MNAHKYIKYRMSNQIGGTKKPKNMDIINRNKGIVCELIHLKAWDDTPEYTLTMSNGLCNDAAYDKYHTNLKNPHNQPSFTFKNSLSKYFIELKEQNAFKFLGSFESNSGKIIVCSEFTKDTNKEKIDKDCVSQKSYKGMYDAYYLNWHDHWNRNDNDTEVTWNKALLIIKKDMSFSELDNLVWHKDLLYAHGSCGVYDYDAFHANDYLPKHNEIFIKPKNGLKVDLYLDDTPHILEKNGVSIYVNEGRPRFFIYGMNKEGYVKSILLHNGY